MNLKSISLKLVVKNPWSNLNLYFSLAFFKMIYLLNGGFYDKNTIHKKVYICNTANNEITKITFYGFLEIF